MNKPARWLGEVTHRTSMRSLYHRLSSISSIQALRRKTSRLRWSLPRPHWSALCRVPTCNTFHCMGLADRLYYYMCDDHVSPFLQRKVISIQFYLHKNILTFWDIIQLVVTSTCTIIIIIIWEFPKLRGITHQVMMYYIRWCNSLHICATLRIDATRHQHRVAAQYYRQSC